MSRFYVGQRVRIKWSVHIPELAGVEGTIIGPAEIINGKKGCVDDGTCFFVAPDPWGSCREPGTNARFAPRSCQLEPATDSYDLVSWKDCAWQPEHLRVNA